MDVRQVRTSSKREKYCQAWRVTSVEVAWRGLKKLNYFTFFSYSSILYVHKSAVGFRKLHKGPIGPALGNVTKYVKIIIKLLFLFPIVSDL